MVRTAASRLTVNADSQSSSVMVRKPPTCGRTDPTLFTRMSRPAVHGDRFLDQPGGAVEAGQVDRDGVHSSVAIQLGHAVHGPGAGHYA